MSIKTIIPPEVNTVIYDGGVVEEGKELRLKTRRKRKLLEDGGGWGGRLKLIQVAKA